MTGHVPSPIIFQQRSNRGRFCAVLLLLISCCCLCLSSPRTAVAAGSDYEILVHAGEIEKTVDYFKSKDFWGKNSHAQDLSVPRIILAVISKRWGKQSQKVPVQIKKELFYRGVLPMILLSNELILAEREDILTTNESLKKTKTLSAAQQARLQALSLKYELEEGMEPEQQLASLLLQVDIIPASMALGQTAYESGYGTSRFAVQGNALFGQWTYNGKGMKARKHRAGKGNYRVAAYQWPFDSVRSYMRNLNSHRAYKELRQKRADLRRQGQAVTGAALIDGLSSYSERGMEYVNILKSIIRVNGLAIADKATLRDEAITLIVAVEGAEKVEETEKKIVRLRASGELDRIICEMGLAAKE